MTNFSIKIPYTDLARLIHKLKAKIDKIAEFFFSICMYKKGDLLFFPLTFIIAEGKMCRFSSPLLLRAREGDLEGEFFKRF